MIYLSNEPYPQEISVPRSFGVIVPHRNEYLSTADIAADLTTDSDTKVLAASQGVALKAMVAAKADKSNTYTKAQVNSALALKADKSNTYTKAQVDEALAEKADVTDIPTKTSDLTNDSGFVTGQEVSQTYETKSDATAKETALQNAINTKQDILTFDNVPTNGSSNPVTSDGIYDALASKQDVITDLATIRSGAAAGATAVQPAALATGLATKQDTLESGQNIKTINNQSLLGSGNIDIQGGGGEPEIFWAEYGVTTAAEIDQAVADGKLVAVKVAYNASTENILLYTNIANTSNPYFSCVLDNVVYFAICNRTSGVWSNTRLFLQGASDRVSDIPANRTSTSKYPNTKAVYDALGKYGVISQTQTWTGGSSTGYTYTMSNQVWGLIPQANIDLYESAGAVFNETTGYFELNGLTDISYEEMRAIYAQPLTSIYSQSRYANSSIRTIITQLGGATYALGGASVQMGNIFNYAKVEVAIINKLTTTVLSNGVLAASMGNSFANNRYLKAVLSPIRVENGYVSNDFKGCYSLETVYIGLKGKKTFSFEDSPNLSVASILYMLNNEAVTTPITITLHATAYARATADADVQAALAAHTNVTLASA